jgi:hypothetical protein
VCLYVHVSVFTYTFVTQADWGPGHAFKQAIESANNKTDYTLKREIGVAIRNIEKWKANFDKLKSVYEDGATIAKLPEKHDMSKWVRDQRRKYWLAVSKGLAMGNRSEPMYPKVNNRNLLPLTQDQVDALEALGMEWDPVRADFEVRLAAIKDYKDRTGSLKGLYKENKELNKWANEQKRRYLKKRNSAGLPEKDANRLRELGFHIPVQAPDGHQHRSEQPKNHLRYKRAIGPGEAIRSIEK